MLAVVSDSQRPMLITFLIGAAGFVLLPLVQELDPRQPQWNYPAVFRAAWRNTVHLALAVCLSISVFVLLDRRHDVPHDRHQYRAGRARPRALPHRRLAHRAGRQPGRRAPPSADRRHAAAFMAHAERPLLPLVALVGLAFTIALAARMALGFEAVKLSAGALIASARCGSS